MHLIFTAARYFSVNECIREGLLLGRINQPILAAVLNSFEKLNSPSPHLRKKKKNTDTTTADTTWFFSVFGIGQASGMRIVVVFLTMVTEFRKVVDRDIAKKKKKVEIKWTLTKEFSLVLLRIILLINLSETHDTVSKVNLKDM